MQTVQVKMPYLRGTCCQGSLGTKSSIWKYRQIVLNSEGTEHFTAFVQPGVWLLQEEEVNPMNKVDINLRNIL